MNEIRKDYLLDRWVIIASERAKRPKDFVIEEKKIHKGTCPFCPGNISMPIIYKRGEPWVVAVVPNKYPAVRSEVSMQVQKGFLEKMNAVGFHEVIIETPNHSDQLENLPASHILEILRTFCDRTKMYMHDERVNYVSIFKNHGAAAGESISHEHSQLIALPVIPHDVKMELEKSESFRREVGVCPFQAIYLRERRSERLLLDHPHFFALAPFASMVPGETWIIPKRHVQRIDHLKKQELEELASLLKTVLTAMKKLFPGMPYNIAYHQSPRGKDLHFHIEIYPRVTKFAGFELGSGMFINVLPPEVYATSFKKVVT